jgi:hypothetical protein
VVDTKLAYPYFAFLPNLKGIINTTSHNPYSSLPSSSSLPTLLDIDETTGRGIYEEEGKEEGVLTVHGACFQNTAFRFHAESQQIEIDAGQPMVRGCADFYLFASTSTFVLENVVKRGRYLIPWPVPVDRTPAEAWDEKEKGIRVLAFKTSKEETLQSVFATAALFEPVLTTGVSERAAKRNVDFMREYAGFVFEKREDEAGREEGREEEVVQVQREMRSNSGNTSLASSSWLRRHSHPPPLPAFPPSPRPRPVINESEVGNGDLFGVIRMDGLDPMLAWGMGATTGHMTVAMWMDVDEDEEGREEGVGRREGGNGDEEGREDEVGGREGGKELYILESQIKSSYWPQNNVQRTPFRQWLVWAEEAGYNVLHVPLSDEARGRFDAAKALAFFKEMEGLAYGYHSMLWGWVDTERENYPCLPPDFTRCMEWNFLEVAFGLVERHVPAISTLLWREAFNLRVGKEGLTTSEVWMEVGKQAGGEGGREGLVRASAGVPVVVERDDWLYHTTRETREGGKEEVLGRAMVCCVFVCGVWKASGVLGEEGGEVNCGELTNADDVMLAIFKGDTKQVLGEWAMFLPAFNEKKVFAHMDERCPSLGPAYERPPDC